MGRFVPLAVGALGALQVLGAIAQGIPACISPCSDQLRTEFGKFSCGSAADAACLCSKADFSYGIRDCAKPCGANDENVRQFLAASGAFCTGLLPPAPNAQTTSPPSAQTTTTGTTQATAPTTTSASSATTQGTLTPTSTSTASSASTSSASPTSSASASPKSSTSASPKSSTSTSTTSSTSSTTSDPPAGPTSSEVAASDASGSGLSKSSVIGICVGVAAGVIVLAAIVIGFLFRSRKRKPRQSMEISKPLPGSGRTYGGRDRGSFEKYGNDIEITTNRYEDMVPRQQPRTMV